MARLPAGATDLSVRFNYITNTTATAGTAKTVGVGKTGVVLGLEILQVATTGSRISRAELLIDGIPCGLPIEVTSTTPDLTSAAGDSNLYSRKSFFFELPPTLLAGSTINVKLKNSSVSSLVSFEAIVHAYEYTP